MARIQTHLFWLRQCPVVWRLLGVLCVVVVYMSLQSRRKTVWRTIREGPGMKRWQKGVIAGIGMLVCCGVHRAGPAGHRAYAAVRKVEQ